MPFAWNTQIFQAEFIWCHFVLFNILSAPQKNCVKNLFGVKCKKRNAVWASKASEFISFNVTKNKFSSYFVEHVLLQLFLRQEKLNIVSFLRTAMKLNTTRIVYLLNTINLEKSVLKKQFAAFEIKVVRLV